MSHCCLTHYPLVFTPGTVILTTRISSSSDRSEVLFCFCLTPAIICWQSLDTSTQTCQRSAGGARVTRVCVWTDSLCLCNRRATCNVLSSVTWRDSSSRAVKAFYLLLDVLQQEWRRPQIVHWDVEEALNLLLMEVHGDQVGETCMGVTDGDVKTLIWRDSLRMHVERTPKTGGSPREPLQLCTHQLYTSCRRWAWRRWSPSSSSYTACCRGSRGGRLWCSWRRRFYRRTPWSASPWWWCSRLWAGEGWGQTSAVRHSRDKPSASFEWCVCVLLLLLVQP